MPREVEGVPEVPPSPLSFSVNLYPSLDVDNLTLDLRTEKNPIPSQFSIDLYSLSETLTSSQVFDLEDHEEPLQTQQMSVPKQIFIDLYSLADINRASESVTEVAPIPKTACISLYPIINVPAPLRQSEDVADIPPSPTNISIDLHPFPWIASSGPGVPTVTQASENLQTASSERVLISGSSFIVQAGEEFRLPEAELVGIQDSTEEEQIQDRKYEGEKITRSSEAVDLPIASVSSIPVRDPDAMAANVLETEQRGELVRDGACFICKEVGHIARDCPKKQRSRKPRG
ncbi:hypothetical protein CPB83DRAFT_493316 [Crepidotus variabilis]|uniref:CCHC-type domain-containing protein n=1 Tax=Crepidotus variabilis TaxID=179855 RepID=A0A9P6ECJ1_9AGAR|nr:hypothetical protein CPB83DRAFT_493316 [Crepidotus variabilis]